MYRISPIGRKSNFHSREKCLIGLVLVTLCFLCFGGIFLLPDNFGGDRVLRVYKHFQKAGPEIFIPAPPLAAHAPHRSEDPHFIGDRRRLEQKIRDELGDILDEPPAAGEGGGDSGAGKGQAPAPAQAPAPEHQDEREAGGDHQAANPVLAAPVQGEGGGGAAGSQSSHPQASSGQQSVLPLGGGGNDQAPDTLDATMEERRQKVKEMMEHAWHNYKLYAWGKNELRPLSQRAHVGSIFGSYDLGATIVDGLDTLYIMGLEKEYREGRDWIERKFSLDNISAELSVFETNIRFVGGMLTLYAFTGDPLYKEKAQHIADKLLPAFQTPTGIPYALVNTKTGVAKNYGWASGGSSILSEFGTLHLEFAYLSDITGNPLYRERVQTIRQVLKEIEKPKGLYPNFLNPKTGKWGHAHVIGRLGRQLL
ncbi:mannosyl-oligosaccharide alpha-1,2-mannosidase IA isoform X3 [Drosophila bipectinata]|uniref:mannosyl-oligosaccharide alpha-1,2-mannosidase IA isoform X3 n=1 Tax=Drosophila bipectinata TaxID=42026 RepID=UPI0038B3831E